MNNIALIESDSEVATIISDYIELFHIGVDHYTSLNDFKGEIDDYGGVILSLRPTDDYESFVLKYKKRENILVVLINEDELPFKGNDYSFSILKKPIISLDEIYDFLVKSELALIEPRDYIEISTSFFIKHKDTGVEAYIELRHDKFVKVSTHDEEGNDDLISRLESKGVKKLFIQSSDSNIFFMKVLQSINESRYFEKNRDVYSVTIDTIEYIHHKLKLMGVKKHDLEFSKGIILNQVRNIEENLNLYQELKRISTLGNWPYRISIMTCYLSILYAKKFLIGSNFNLDNFIQAALFQDISLNEDEQAQYSTRSSIPKGIEEVILNHPLKSSKMINEIEGVDIIVGDLIKVHHERPSNIGFPGNIDITSLSVPQKIFLLANHSAYYVLENDSVNKDKFQDFLKSNYSIRGFNNIIKSFNY